jgi:hypothetical protein
LNSSANQKTFVWIVATARREKRNRRDPLQVISRQDHIGGVWW